MRHRNSVVNPALRQQVTQRLQWMAWKISKALPVEPGLTVDPALRAMALPDQVGLHPDDGIAPPHLAAGDRFQHERIGTRVAQLQHKADRRVQIRRQPRPDDLVAPGVPARLELGKPRRELHQGRLVCTALIAAWSSVIPA